MRLAGGSGAEDVGVLHDFLEQGVEIEVLQVDLRAVDQAIKAVERTAGVGEQEHAGGGQLEQSRHWQLPSNHLLGLPTNYGKHSPQCQIGVMRANRQGLAEDRQVVAVAGGVR